LFGTGGWFLLRSAPGTGSYVQHVSDVNTSILRSLRLICWVISWVVLFWFDVCWCYVVVWLWWCGIRMQAEALLAYSFGMWGLGVNGCLEQGVGFSCALLRVPGLTFNMFRMLIHPSSGACDLFVELLHGLYCSCSMGVGVTLWFG